MLHFLIQDMDSFSYQGEMAPDYHGKGVCRENTVGSEAAPHTVSAVAFPTGGELPENWDNALQAFRAHPVHLGCFLLSASHLILP